MSVSYTHLEGIQGVGGIQLPTDEFMQALREACTAHNTILVLDEIQSGYGRSGIMVGYWGINFFGCTWPLFG